MSRRVPRDDIPTRDSGPGIVMVEFDKERALRVSDAVRALCTKLLPYATSSEAIGHSLAEFEALIDDIKVWVKMNPRPYVTGQYPPSLRYLYEPYQITDIENDILTSIRHLNRYEGEARSQQLSSSANLRMTARGNKDHRVRREARAITRVIETFHTNLILNFKSLEARDRAVARQFKARSQTLLARSAEIDRRESRDHTKPISRVETVPVKDDTKPTIIAAQSEEKAIDPASQPPTLNQPTVIAAQSQEKVIDSASQHPAMNQPAPQTRPRESHSAVKSQALPQNPIPPTTMARYNLTLRRLQSPLQREEADFDATKH